MQRNTGKHSSRNAGKLSSEYPRTYQDFWNWFQKNEKAFFKAVKAHTNIEKNFFDKLSPKLEELKEGYFFLTGMYDENTAELVLTADGNINHIVFVEELVAAAPQIPAWKFTALKPASDIKDFSINMAGYQFSDENMSFYPNHHPDYPDEIDITIIHQDLTQKNQDTISNGTYIFLDNYLGELHFATTIDSIRVEGKENAPEELIPISKLKDYLIWREKEFLEKYEGTRHNTENDNYSMLEAALESGNVLLAVIDTDLLAWDSKASHPWILAVEIKFDGENNNGMPNDETYRLLDDIENEILKHLQDQEGYLYIGRQTADSVREIYFACKDFRKPSLVVHQVQERYSGSIELSYDIYKDKYWRSFNRFMNPV